MLVLLGEDTKKQEKFVSVAEELVFESNQMDKTNSFCYRFCYKT